MNTVTTPTGWPRPGDVAEITTPHGTFRAIRAMQTWRCEPHPKADTYYDDVEVSSARPLVVVDPDSLEQMQALLAGYRRRDTGSWEEDITLSLRDLLASEVAGPEEPTHFGAIVTDVRGVRYLRVSECLDAPWLEEGDACGSRLRWSDFDVTAESIQGAEARHERE